MNAPSLLTDAPACCDGATWEPLPDWPHEVSSCGQMRSIDRLGGDGVWRLGGMLPPQVDKRPGKGYVYYDLRDGNRRRRIPAAVAVLEAHDRARPGPDYEACHLFDVRTDNHRARLAWDTKAANLAQMWERRRALTDAAAELSREGLACHSAQVTAPGSVLARLSRRSVTGDGPQGTGRSPIPHSSSSQSSSVQPRSSTLRTSFRSLRERIAA